MKILLLALFTSANAATLDFNGALEQILRRDTQIPSQQSVSDAAEIRALSGKLRFLPSLEVGHSKTETHRASSELDQSFITGRLNLFKGGADWASMRASSYNFDYEAQGVRQTALSSEENAIQALVNFILRKRQVEILGEILAMKEDSLKTTRSRYQKGLTSRQEVDKALVDLNNARARLLDSRVALRSATAVLNSLLGHTEVKTAWPWRKKLENIDNHELLALNLKWSERPDYRRAELRLERDKQNVAALWRSLSPRFDISHTWNRNDYGSQLNYERTTVLSVAFPLFNGLSDYAGIQEGKASLITARYQLTQLVRDVGAEWESIKANLVTRVETAKNREVNLKLSRRLYKDNFNRFQKGRTTVNDLQLDQNRLLDSENLSNEGWAEAHLAWQNFCHARGLSIFNCQ